MKRALATLLVAATLLPAPALAAPKDLEQAKALHQKAQARFDTADYEGAIDAWTQAYEALPNEASSARMKPFILYNIATAREKAYEVGLDVAQLRQAKILLETFRDAIPRIYVDSAEAAAERERVQTRIAAIDAKIGAHEGPAPEPEPESEPEPEPEPEPTRDSGRPWVIAGAALTGVGAALGGVAIAGAVIGSNANEIGPDVEQDYDERGEQFERGRAGNAMAIAGAIGAPVMLGAGVALIVIGKRRSRRSTSARVVPVAGRTHAGLVVHGRF